MDKFTLGQIQVGRNQAFMPTVLRGTLLLHANDGVLLSKSEYELQGYVNALDDFWKCIFLGYEPDDNFGSRLWDPKNRQVV